MRKILYKVSVIIFFIAGVSMAADFASDSENFEKISDELPLEIKEGFELLEEILGLSQDNINVDAEDKDSEEIIAFDSQQQERILKEKLHLAEEELALAKDLYTNEEVSRKLIRLGMRANRWWRKHVLHTVVYEKIKEEMAQVRARSSVLEEVKAQRIQQAHSRVTSARRAIIQWGQKYADENSQLAFVKEITQKELDSAKEELQLAEKLYTHEEMNRELTTLRVLADQLSRGYANELAEVQDEMALVRVRFSVSAETKAERIRKAKKQLTEVERVVGLLDKQGAFLRFSKRSAQADACSKHFE